MAGAPHELREAIREAGLRLGFAQVGFAPAEAPLHGRTYVQWLERGRHGEMEWMARADAMRRRLDPRAALPGCRALVIASLAYAPDPAREALDSTLPASGVVARYAVSRDYHEVFEDRLAVLGREIQARFPAATVLPYVDYGPVLERDHAQRAGLGWIGKNTMLIHPVLGSWLLLGEILTTADIPADDAFEPDRCGTCARCMEACPTDAIVAARELDASRCISYLTIELRGSIPEGLRPAIGTRVFGCDICQEVCPWNDAAPPADASALEAGRPAPPATLVSWTEEVLDLSDDGYRSRYAGTPFVRPRREGMLRNLCVGLGNSGDPRALPPLVRCLDDPSPIVREHAAWGLGRLGELRARPR